MGMEGSLTGNVLNDGQLEKGFHSLRKRQTWNPRSLTHRPPEQAMDLQLRTGEPRDRDMRGKQRKV